MPRHQFSDREKDILKVITYGIDCVADTPSLEATAKTLDESISKSKVLLRSIGRMDDLAPIEIKKEPPVQKTLVIRSLDDLLKDANERYPDFKEEHLFSRAELAANEEYIRQLYAEFNAVHKLDKVEIIIPTVAGILSGTIDCVFGGFVKDANGRNIPGTMTEFVKKQFDKILTPDRIKKLEKLAKSPYDALNYSNVNGLSTYFHHVVALGHDPILGFIFGVLDILRGTVTTLDFNGKFLIQTVEGFSDKKAQNLFQAIATVFLHMLSDVNGSSSSKEKGSDGMGLPVPFMALFNKLQFGKIGAHDTISELVKSMFGQGYDFRHFCSMSIPVMITEVIVRVSYFAKRLHDGYTFSEAIPVGIDHTKKPKLGTMLFIAHSASTAINAGKVALTENPLNINYPQWLAFARYSVKQLKWALIEKPALRDKYVMGIINNEWEELSTNIDSLWNEYIGDTIIVFASEDVRKK